MQVEKYELLGRSRLIHDIPHVLFRTVCSDAIREFGVDIDIACMIAHGHFMNVDLSWGFAEGS